MFESAYSPQNSYIDALVELGHSKSVGNKRRVLRFEHPELGAVFLKDKQSRFETEIIQVFGELGISEKIIESNDTTILVRAVSGRALDEYQVDIIGVSDNELGTNLEALERLIVDYVAKFYVLLLSGVFHNDNKIDNVFVEDNGTTCFIDFGEATEVNSDPMLYINRYNANLLKYIANIKVYLPKVQSFYVSLESDMVVQNMHMPEILAAMYDYYREHNTPITERLSVVQRTLIQYRSDFIDEIAKMGFPDRITEQVIERIEGLFSKS